MKLFVIGNGFDISHGIPCGYANFYDYLKENKVDTLNVMEKFYNVDSSSDLWSDFENSLEANIIYDELTEIIFENVPNVASDDFSDSSWYDAQISIKQECDELLKSIRYGFEEWIASLNTFKINKVYKLDRSACYITFNYTDLLERKYNISPSNILHIHNKVGEELIFGHGKSSADFKVRQALYGDENAFLNIDENGNIESSSVVGHERFAENAVLTFYDKMRKKTEDVIQQHSSFFKSISEVDEVLILGHSYNEIDLPYYEKIAESVDKKARWILYYYSEKDKENAEKVMRQIGVVKHLQEYKHCDDLKVKDTQLKLF